MYSLGRDPVIKGLEEGLLGMREGGKRRLLIPSELGYQNKQQVPIPRSFGNRQRLYSTVLNTERTVPSGRRWVPTSPGSTIPESFYHHRGFLL